MESIVIFNRVLFLPASVCTRGIVVVSGKTSFLIIFIHSFIVFSFSHDKMINVSLKINLKETIRLFEQQGSIFKMDLRSTTVLLCTVRHDSSLLWYSRRGLPCQDFRRSMNHFRFHTYRVEKKIDLKITFKKDVRSRTEKKM